MRTEADRTTVPEGGLVTFDITVTNQGPDPAYDLRANVAIATGGQILVGSLPIDCAAVPVSPVDQVSSASPLPLPDGKTLATAILCQSGYLPSGRDRTFSFTALAGAGDKRIETVVSVRSDSETPTPANDGTSSVTPSPRDRQEGASCSRCLEKYQDACRLVCRADGSTKPGANMTCEQCIESVRRHECEKECRTKP